MNNGSVPWLEPRRQSNPPPRGVRRLVRIVIAVVLVGAGAGWYRVSVASEPSPPPVVPPVVPQSSLADTAARAPKGTRIRVRVLNSTTTHGLAKRMTFALRDFGYDVVDFDNDPKTKRSSTLIVSHTGHAEWAQHLRRAVGTGTIEARSDSLRYVDFTVFVGNDWKAPAQPFRP